jgi:DNA-binding transcriptional regulator YiaG
MSAKAPPVGEVLATRLRVLGERIRTHRERQKVSATVAAEASGMSRGTLRRIERGEPRVSIGCRDSILSHVCRSNIEPGVEADFETAGCG